MKYLIFSFFVFLLLFSCKQSEDHDADSPIARFNDQYLYKEDIQSYMPAVYGDSLTAVDECLKIWIKKRLLTNLAVKNLSNDMSEIDKLVESYRSSLLIQRYLEKYIGQNLDTNISDSELEKYYRQFRPDFVLSFNAIKGLFIVIPKSAPDFYKVRNWYRSDNEDKIKKLDIYCNQYALKYDDFSDDWVAFDMVLNEIPYVINDQKAYLKYNKSIETSDSLNNFYLKITNYKLKNDTSPLVFVKEKIKDIVINKRKINLVKQLEKDLYQDALNRKEVEIY